MKLTDSQKKLGILAHAQTVCTRPFLHLSFGKGPGDEASGDHDQPLYYNVAETCHSIDVI